MNIRVNRLCLKKVNISTSVQKHYILYQAVKFDKAKNLISANTVKQPYISWVCYFAFFPMNVSLLEFNFVIFEL